MEGKDENVGEEIGLGCLEHSRSKSNLFHPGPTEVTCETGWEGNALPFPGWVTGVEEEPGFLVGRDQTTAQDNAGKQHFLRDRIQSTGSVSFGMNPARAHQATMNCPVRPHPATQ